MDLAFERIPGWRELSENTLTIPEFRNRHLHSATAGLHVIANVIAAARIADVEPRKVVDALAERGPHRGRRRGRGAPSEYAVHVFFEGTLAKAAYDERALFWRAGASGATRSNYELAIKTVLRHLATRGVAGCAVPVPSREGRRVR
ncbi:hypothetical protein OG949_01010 [Streptomyces scopuliridis]|uniref:hypothetical protein n=1 Tax=Streptomyces scopuliridis TaxID=452529 RepID=UPI002DD89AEE|nr:hypothetical protein [Streptomyces scopuliridis]WSB31597.1 hypothetical protein OG949_01010 [Streptomyces scopuliridis]